MTQQQDAESRLNATLERIGEHVESIARFVGRSAELQMQTQYKLDEFGENITQVSQKLDRIADTLQAQDEKWDRRLDILTTSVQDLSRNIQEQDQAWNQRIDRLVTAIEGQQQTTQELIKLVAVLAQRAS